MQTIGFIGLGKIGLPICTHLLRHGYRVLGYRRNAMTDFEALGGTPMRSPAEIGGEADVVFSCLPNDDALDEVIRGGNGLLETARPGQIIVEFGSHSVPVKQSYVRTLAEKGAIFLDGEVSGTPGMVVARKGVIYLSGEEAACRTIEPIVATFADLCLFLGPFGSSTTVKIINNLLVGLHIAGAAQAMAIGLRAGIDVDLMIKAIATGSGGSTQFAIRAPWMAERRFLPQQGSAAGLLEYLERAQVLAGDVGGVATPLLDCVVDLYRRAVPAIGARDVGAILEAFEADGPRN